MKIDEYTVDGCRMADLRLIDEYGNVYWELNKFSLFSQY
jgi:hypothetical protein